MVRLDEEADLVVYPANQGVEHIGGDVDDRLAIGALQMRVRTRRDLSTDFGYGEVIDRRGTADVSVSDQSQLPQCR